MNSFEFRDAALQAGLAHTKRDKGKKRDIALFDYLCGACAAAFILGEQETDCPPWLWVIGIRAGNRVAEAETMLQASIAVGAPDDNI